jgi:hypothetical protein
MNALKYGLKSKKLAAERRESDEFLERFDKWMKISGASDDMEEFLVFHNVSLSFDVEYVDHVRRERSKTLIDNAAETEFLAVLELGQRLFFNAAAATSLYGIPTLETKNTPKSSWDGKAVSENDPAVLVRRLEATQLGVSWLLDQFQALRDQLDSPGFWLPHDRFKCIRLLSGQPIHANADIRVSTVFVASHGLKPTSENEFSDLLSDMDETQLVVYSEQVRARFPELFLPREPSEHKQMLLDLLDAHIDQLNELLREHEANSDQHIQQTVDRLRVDLSPEGTILRSHMMRCTDRLHRGLEAVRKHQAYKSQRGENLLDYWPELAPPRLRNAARRKPRDGGDDPVERPGDDMSRRWNAMFEMGSGLFPPHERAAQSSDVDDRNAQSDWITPDARTTPADGADPICDPIDSAALATSVDVPGLSESDEITGNLPNEAGCSESRILDVNRTGVGITANSGIEFELDNSAIFASNQPPEASHLWVRHSQSGTSIRGGPPEMSGALGADDRWPDLRTRIGGHAADRREVGTRESPVVGARLVENRESAIEAHGGVAQRGNRSEQDHRNVRGSLTDSPKSKLDQLQRARSRRENRRNRLLNAVGKMLKPRSTSSSRSP